MDLQTMLNNAMAADRAESMKNSEQLTLVELLLKLQAVKNKDLPVVFDDGKYNPDGLDSWRGSYSELAFTYSKVGEKENGGSYNTEEVEWTSSDGQYSSYKQEKADLPLEPKVSDVIELLERVQGKTFTGYKGGDFTMGKSTPLWVANYGDSSGFKEAGDDDDAYLQAVIDILEANDAVSIITKLSDF
jgi:hypothetical protein